MSNSAVKRSKCLGAQKLSLQTISFLFWPQHQDIVSEPSNGDLTCFGCVLTNACTQQSYLDAVIKDFLITRANVTGSTDELVVVVDWRIYRLEAMDIGNGFNNLASSVRQLSLKLDLENSVPTAGDQLAHAEAVCSGAENGFRRQ